MSNENSVSIFYVAHEYNMFMKYCTMGSIFNIIFFAQSLFGYYLPTIKRAEAGCQSANQHE